MSRTRAGEAATPEGSGALALGLRAQGAARAGACRRAGRARGGAAGQLHPGGEPGAAGGADRRLPGGERAVGGDGAAQSAIRRHRWTGERGFGSVGSSQPRRSGPWRPSTSTAPPCGSELPSLSRRAADPIPPERPPIAILGVVTTSVPGSEVDRERHQGLGRGPPAHERRRVEDARASAQHEAPRAAGDGPPGVRRGELLSARDPVHVPLLPRSTPRARPRARAPALSPRP